MTSERLAATAATKSVVHRRPLREFFWLGARLERARQARYTRKDPGFSDFELGLALLRDARELAGAEAGGASALFLYRAAIRLLARATALRSGAAATGLNWPGICARVAAALPTVPLASAPELLDAGDLSLAGLAPADAEQLIQRLRPLAEALARPLETAATAVRQIETARWVRVGTALALLVVGIVCAVVAYRTAHGARTNLALNKPVTLSDSDPVFGVNPRALVNGDVGDLGFHSSLRPNTSVTIDLGSLQPISEVVVYNRADCCQERLPPLVLQLSSDGKNYETIAQKNETFDRWDEHLPAQTKSRYVRLVHPRNDFFHLSEVEVYR